VPERSPEAVLASHGLAPGPPQVLDAASDVSVVGWQRSPGRR
jgi:hypothetical protein